MRKNRILKSLIFISAILLIGALPNISYSALFTISGGTISSNTTWGPNTNDTYHVTGNITINDGITLQINPGTTVKFVLGVQMTVYGTLDANGIESNKVVFTSVNDDSYGDIISGSSSTPTAGDWDGIFLNGGGNYDGIGQFDYCILRYGGTATTGSDPDANVYFYYSDSGYFNYSVSEYSSQHGVKINNCSPSLTNSAFQNNGTAATHDGIYASGTSAAPTITDNEFHNNLGYGAYMNNISLTSYSGNTGSGNGINGFGVIGTIKANRTWSSSSAFPFVIPGAVTVNDNLTLTIDAGTILKGNSSGQLTVYGTLDVNGTSGIGNNVVFTSLKDDNYGGNTDGDNGDASPGDWRGIFLNGGGNYDGIGQFDYCILRYGGIATTGSDPDANVYFYYSDSGYFNYSVSEYSSQHGVKINNCSPSLTNSIFQNNDNHGIYASNTSSAPIITNNQFHNNLGYGAYMNNISLTSYSGNTGSGNGINGFGVIGTIKANRTWSSSSAFPFVIPGAVTVNDNLTLTIDAGTILKGNSSGQLTVYGTLDVNGTSGIGNNVVFTSLKDDNYGGNTDGDNGDASPGDWRGIFLNGGGNDDGIGRFDYCILRYGGTATTGDDPDANLYFYYSDSGYFNYSVSEYSSQHGVKIHYCSPSLTNSIFQNNNNHGIYASNTSSAPTITNNEFHNNLGYGAYMNNISLTSYSGNTGSGNGINGFGVIGTIKANRTWSSSSTFPFVIPGVVTVNDNLTLTIDAGTILKGNSSGQLTVYGTLDVNGASGIGNNVVFTSLKDDNYGGNTDGDNGDASPGDWRGIFLNGGGNDDGIGRFDYSILRYGGNGTTGADADANVYFYYSDSGYFNYSVSEYSYQDGIRVYNSSPSFVNAVIRRNATPSSTGGGFYFSGSSSTLMNTTVANNSCASSGNGGGLYCTSSSNITITNSIFWDNSPYQIYQAGSGVSIYYSDIQGGPGGIAGTGSLFYSPTNINLDPLFADPSNNNYRLQFGSPCLNRGTPSGAPVVDIDGNPRPDPAGSSPDMGAYESALGWQSYLVNGDGAGGGSGRYWLPGGVDGYFDARLIAAQQIVGGRPNLSILVRRSRHNDQTRHLVSSRESLRRHHGRVFRLLPNWKSRKLRFSHVPISVVPGWLFCGH